METLNDIAIAEHYGIRALGAAVYDLWLNRGDLRASCRLASLMLILVAALAALENMGRNRQRQYILHCDRCFECERAPKIGGFAGGFLLAVILLPAVGGFFSAAGMAALSHTGHTDRTVGGSAWRWIIGQSLIIVATHCGVGRCRQRIGFWTSA